MLLQSFKFNDLEMKFNSNISVLYTREIGTDLNEILTLIHNIFKEDRFGEFELNFGGNLKNNFKYSYINDSNGPKSKFMNNYFLKNNKVKFIDFMNIRLTQSDHNFICDNMQQFNIFMHFLGLNDKFVKYRDNNEHNYKVGSDLKHGILTFDELPISFTKLALIFINIILESDLELVIINNFDSSFHHLLTKELIGLISDKDIQLIITAGNNNLLNMSGILDHKDFYIIDNGKCLSFEDIMAGTRITSNSSLDRIYTAYCNERNNI